LLICHFLVVLCVAGVWYGTKGACSTLLVGGVLCSLLYAFLCLQEAQRSSLFITPLSALLFWLWVVCGPAAIYEAFTHTDGDAIELTLWTVNMPDVAAGYVVYLVGAVALHAGLIYAMPKGKNGMDIKKTKTNGGLVPLIFAWAVGFVANYNHETVLSFGQLAIALRWLPLAATCYFALSTPRFVKKNGALFGVLLVLQTLLLCFLYSRSLLKSALVFCMLPAVWYWISRTRNVKTVVAFGASVLILYLLVIAPLVTAARTQPYTGLSASERMEVAWQDWAFSNTSESANLQAAAGALFDRAFEGVAIGYFVHDVEEHGFQRGATFDYLAWAFIPRVFWVDKPVVNRGIWFYHYLGMPEQKGSETSLGMTAQGELYWNFGMVGTIIGMFVLGASFGFMVWRISGDDPTTGVVEMLAYVTATLSVLEIGSEFGSIFLGLISYGIIFRILRRGSDFFVPKRRMCWTSRTIERTGQQ
jgi:hypothetical protein